MPIQTVFRAGNSNVVAIPKSFSKDWDIKPGEKVIIEEKNSDELVIRKTSKANKKLQPDKEFKKWWDEFIKENSEVLDELALR